MFNIIIDMTTFTTIEQHLIDITNSHPDIPSTIPNILYDISLASKMIRKQVLVAGFQSSSTSGKTNIHGENVQALDIFANDCLKQILSAHGHFSYLVSEEEDEIVTVDTNKNNSHIIFFDPLDGSSNIDVNISVGTIFSIFDVPPSWDSKTLQPGRKQVAAGYVIYGSSVVMVYTTGRGVYGFTYDPSIGEFLLSHDTITIPKTPAYYSINESLYPNISPHLQETIQSYKTPEKGPLSARYVGSLVADFHRNLLKGGIFAYPGTVNKPNGKLRLMYEANPLAFICEQAGGSATNGEKPILDILPTNIHEKTPLFIGNTSLVEEIKLKAHTL